MQNEYVIDENVIYDAWRGKDSQKRKAIPERTFVYSFLNSDERLAMTPYIQMQYYGISKQTLSDQQFMDAGIIPMFMERMVDENKSRVYDGLKPNYKHIKEGDDEFVCVSIHVDGNLVTKDGRLKNEIIDEGLENKVNYYDVSDALSLLNN